MTAVGVIVGSGKFWRALGGMAGIAFVTQKVMKDAGKFVNDVVDIIGRKKFEEIIGMPKGSRPPQGLRYPGGSLQFIINSNEVTNQTSRLIGR